MYAAVIVYGVAEAANVEFEQVAMPEEFRVTSEHRMVAPVLKVTVPVAPEGVTVAVNIAACPYVVDEAPVTTVVEVAAQ